MQIIVPPYKDIEFRGVISPEQNLPPIFIPIQGFIDHGLIDRTILDYLLLFDSQANLPPRFIRSANEYGFSLDDVYKFISASYFLGFQKDSDSISLRVDNGVYEYQIRCDTHAAKSGAKSMRINELYSYTRTDNFEKDRKPTINELIDLTYEQLSKRQDTLAGFKSIVDKIHEGEIVVGARQVELEIDDKHYRILPRVKEMIYEDEDSDDDILTIHCSELGKTVYYGYDGYSIKFNIVQTVYL